MEIQDPTIEHLVRGCEQSSSTISGVRQVSPKNKRQPRSVVN